MAHHYFHLPIRGTPSSIVGFMLFEAIVAPDLLNILTRDISFFVPFGARLSILIPDLATGPRTMDKILTGALIIVAYLISQCFY